MRLRYQKVKLRTLITRQGYENKKPEAVSGGVGLRNLFLGGQDPFGGFGSL